MTRYLWEHTGSNRGPSACKADALNQLSYAPFILECKYKSVFILKKNIFIFNQPLSTFEPIRKIGETKAENLELTL